MKKFYVEAGIVYGKEESDYGEWSVIHFEVKAKTVESAKQQALGIGLERNNVTYTWIYHIEEMNDSFIEGSIFCDDDDSPLDRG